jgi:hypothetical protein
VGSQLHIAVSQQGVSAPAGWLLHCSCCITTYMHAQADSARICITLSHVQIGCFMLCSAVLFSDEFAGSCLTWHPWTCHHVICPVTFRGQVIARHPLDGTAGLAIRSHQLRISPTTHSNRSCLRDIQTAADQHALFGSSAAANVLFVLLVNCSSVLRHFMPCGSNRLY